MNTSSQPVHNILNIIKKGSLFLLCTWSLFALLACSNNSEKRYVNTLNEKSYFYHYRNIDSTTYYAQQAYKLSDNYSNGRAAALNNLAFVHIAKMDYSKAVKSLNEVIATTDNQIELLIADVQMMRVCQRKSMNKEFYDYYNKAVERLKRIKEEIGHLDQTTKRPNNQTTKQRLAYAESEFYIVSSTYYYYVGMYDKSRDNLLTINADDLIQIDSAQVANYLYNIGSGGIVLGENQAQIAQTEKEHLYQCRYIGEKNNYIFWQANVLQALAEHNLTENPQQATEEAEQSLALFKQYGDIYQIAGAYRTLANCHITQGNYTKALDNLKLALNYNPRIDYAPDLLASIHERLSVVYAAMGQMYESIYNRREYLALQEGKRQDRFLENRLETLKKESVQRTLWIVGVITAIILLIIMLNIFYRMRKNIRKKNEANRLAELTRLEEKYEEIQEQTIAAKQKLIHNKKCNLENRAKISLINSLLPLIDRMVYSIGKIENNDAHNKAETLEYITEIAEEINKKNELLTEWIQMRQGELSLKVETFELQPLFDILKKAKISCQMKGVALEINDTTDKVKADKTLTTFMLNTLIDNARKFTPPGGTITVSSKSTDDYVEISVTDTGKGIDQNTLSNIFDHKIYDGHGFGLMNCKGIIEKYKKVSSLFKNTLISAESEKGKGSRFFFRLPKGTIRTIIVIICLWVTGTGFCDSLKDESQKPVPAIHLDSMAVAALQDKDFKTYNEYNNAFIKQLKDNSVDKKLPDYCKTIQKGQVNKMIAIILLVIIMLTTIPLYYLLVWRFAKHGRLMQESMANKITNKKTQIELAEDMCRKINMENSNFYISNNVLDNCLSTLKHETMYYPSRIRESILSNRLQITDLKELITYYKDLYMILDEQAMREIDKNHLQLTMYHIPCTSLPQSLPKGKGFKSLPLGGDLEEAPQTAILGDKILIDYLLSLLGGTSTGFSTSNYIKHYADGDYVVLKFKNTITEIDYLIVKQIIRDHADATNLRACGIDCTDNEITIKLPRYGKI